MDYFRRRKLRKQLKEYLQGARHARNMREDIADPQDLAALEKAEAAVREISETGQGDVEKAVENLAEATDRVYPSINRTGIRENVEVLIVALAAAMAIRAFFFQPFKIPTGSMQPTLNGITTEVQAEPTFMDRQPLKFVKWLATGTSYKAVVAKESGYLEYVRETPDNAYFKIGNSVHKFSKHVFDLHRNGGEVDYARHYAKGDVIASKMVIAGDHILVNKMKYNFMAPERGDIAVFDTRNITHPEVRKDTFYIKRMVGLPGEKIQIQGNHIVADGEVVDDPPIFKKIDTDPNYAGHVLATYTPGRPRPLLLKESDILPLGEDQYLMMGDNTVNSLDGRYFGGVPRRDFQGPAMFVYWPFREHWGVVH